MPFTRCSDRTQVVTGDRDAGAALAGHPAVSMVSFTGSSFTGSKVMAACAPRLAQSALELGGKSALVVFADTDTDCAVETAMKGRPWTNPNWSSQYDHVTAGCTRRSAPIKVGDAAETLGQ